LPHYGSQADELLLCSDADALQYHYTLAEKPPVLVIINAILIYPMYWKNEVQI
jgi:hypothetical protein